MLIASVISGEACAQQWRRVDTPPEAQYIIAAVNRTVPGAIALWYSLPQIADSARTSVLTPWVLSTSADGGMSWSRVDSGRFYNIVTGPGASASSIWHELHYVGAMLVRSIRLYSLGAHQRTILQRRDGVASFRELEFPVADARDLVYPAENGLLLYPASDPHGKADSTDFAVFRNTGDNTWTFMPDGAPRWSQVSPVSDLTFRLNSQNLMWAATSEGVLRTANGGESWDPVRSRTPLDEMTITRIVAHPRTAQPLFAAAMHGGGLYPPALFRSMDNGNSWAAIFGDPGQSLIAFARSAPEVVLMSTGSDLLLSVDTGATWRSIASTVPFPINNGSILSLAIDPANPFRAWIADARSLYATDALLGAEDRPLVPEPIALSAFPNPSHTTAPLTLRVHTSEEADIELYDVLGRRLFERHVDRSVEPHFLTLDTGTAPALERTGTFLLLLRSASTSIGLRLVRIP